MDYQYDTAKTKSSPSNPNPFILLSTFSYLWNSPDFHRKVSHTLQQQNPVINSKINNKNPCMHFVTFPLLESWLSWMSITALMPTKEVTAQTGEGKRTKMLLMILPNWIMKPYLWLLSGKMTAHMLIELRLRLFINRFHITLHQITGFFFYSS